MRFYARLRVCFIALFDGHLIAFFIKIDVLRRCRSGIVLMIRAGSSVVSVGCGGGGPLDVCRVRYCLFFIGGDFSKSA